MLLARTADRSAHTLMVGFVAAIALTLVLAVAAPARAETPYTAFGWGQDTQHQLGNGTFDAFDTLPTNVAKLTSVEAVSAGGEHSLGLLSGGTVWSWGSNLEGQLGDGTNVSRNEPVQVTAVSGAKAVAAGGAFSLALLGTGTVMAWGANESGQLGDGNFQAESNVPVAVKGLTNVKAIAAGSTHSLALLNTGTVMAWGDNTSGELGNGTVKTSDVPVAVKGLTGVIAIAAGDEFSLAVLSNGTVEAWGNNELGQLGNPALAEEEDSLLPVAVTGVTGATSVAAGLSHGLALLSGGTVMGWGGDASGQVVNGVLEPRVNTPVAVGGLSGVSAISAGGLDSAALLAGGSVMTWGANTRGTLGDGTAGSPSAVPVSVGEVERIAGISTGGAHMLAFGEPIPGVSSLSPASGPTAGGTSVEVTGTHLEGATAVAFGSTPATSFTVNSATSITATAPAGTGTVDVSVTTATGSSPKSTADHFTYIKPPTVTSLKPKLGPIAGGTTVVIGGTELTGATSVRFGSESASFKVNSSKSITATAPPAAAAGYAFVTVTTPGGTSVASTKGRYSYAPTVESVSPSTGLIAGGEAVTVTGTGFALGSTATIFKFGTHRALSVSCTSTTTCTMLSPKTTVTGTVDVVATVAKILSPKVRPQDAFTYE